MKIIWGLIYNLVILPVLYFLVLIGTLFNSKLREGFIGRFYSISTLRSFFSGKNQSREVYWFHVASHGEFQQALPVIKGLKEIEPSCLVLVSFFSPSGFNHAGHELVDCKFYLPFDFIWTVQKTLNIINPKKIIFAGYDIWPNLVWISNLQNIHTTIFATHINSRSPKLYPVIKNFYRSIYDSFSTIYTISGLDYLHLQKIVSTRNSPLIRVLGNPRFDHVKDHADSFSKERTKSLLDRKKRIIAGSVWPEDESIIIEPLIQLLKENKEIFLLWIPHEPKDEAINSLVHKFVRSGIVTTIHSSANSLELGDSQVVVVGVVGILSKLYWQGQIAYIGGGFSSGVHNVMEPAIARLPVLFGSKYDNSQEAKELIATGGGFSITTSNEFSTHLRSLLNNQEHYINTSFAATDVIHNNLGSSTRVVRGIIRD